MDQSDLQVRRGAGEQGRESRGPPSSAGPRLRDALSRIRVAPVIATPVGRQTGGFHRARRRSMTLWPGFYNTIPFYIGFSAKSNQRIIFCKLARSRAQNYAQTLSSDNKSSVNLASCICIRFLFIHILNKLLCKYCDFPLHTFEW